VRSLFSKTPPGLPDPLRRLVYFKSSHGQLD
jgi:hypothetical protein